MSRTFLYVEDDENDIYFMKRAIRDAGIPNHYHILTDGREVIDYLKGTGPYADRREYPLPFLILLDLKLPHLNGLEILKWIRSHRAFETILVVILTSSSENEDVDSAYSLGANSFLVKPARTSKLQGMVDALCEYWFRQNEEPPIRALRK